jgi:streptomycin 6-kinase
MARWRLQPDGEPVATPNGRLQPVRWRGQPCILKVATDPEERAGADLLAWWAGDGAARVLARDGDAILLERATGPGDLARMAREGRDEEASAIVCDVVARLHAQRPAPIPPLEPLSQRFAALAHAAAAQGGILSAADAAARDLLASPREIVPLHGDVHHGNVLDFGARGWLAIDPKGLLGERGFDYANLFCNPDAATATDPARFARRLSIVGARARLERGRLLSWILAWAGLSAAWHIEDGSPPETALAVARLAATELGR